MRNRLGYHGALFLAKSLRSLSQRQLWHLQDLRHGGGLVFTVELFLFVLNEVLSLSESPHQDPHSTLYIATFRVITSDWRKYNHSLETQKLLLDAIASDQGIVHQLNYPTKSRMSSCRFLGRFLEGQTGPHIQKAVQQLSIPDNHPGIQEFRAKALTVISLFRASSS